MSPSRPALLALATVALAAGCTTPAVERASAPASTPGTESTSAAAAPSPTGAPARDQLLAALEKSRQSTYRFSVTGDVPDKQKVAGSGAFDPKAKRLSVKYKITGKEADQAERIVVGTDLYSREKSNETWVHLDLKRIKKDSLYWFDMTDPTGLSRFTSSVDQVRSTGPNAFAGTLDIEGDKFNDGFLPVGTPAISVWFGGNAQFTATTDAAGWVTSIGVTLRDSDGALKMTTRLSGHGKPSGVKKPSNYGEAWDFYYDKK
ncbi:hypothetical protein Aca07nite_52640 [Actinoplanes capillaceus]|uniref:Lipoprotein n=1 Tax=Actinoplanes campanulatus TaxID=113559 RepID=A0ABQ3WP02_9ACTN|nr:hypothetical protein [Actinoplanes capillaceus]GID47989.1 hypothetical protein Aca07nite_52640 [Actinoplanes capillaceus]